jgi:integrase
MPSGIRLNEAIETYLSVLKAQGMASSTIVCRRSALLRFLGAVGNIYPRNLTPEHTDRFLVAHAHWSPATRRQNIGYLSTFQSWLWARNLLKRDVDLCEGKRRIRIPKTPKVWIKQDQFERLLDAAGNPRDRIILGLGIYLVVRRSELINIRWKDVDLGTGYVEIYRTKTQEADRLPISAELDTELRRWQAYLCRTLDVVAPDREWYVACAIGPARERDPSGRFIGTGTEAVPLPARQLPDPLDRIKSILASVGVEGPGVGMHTLRRSGMQAMLESIERTPYDGSALDAVGSMAGHKSRQTTELYLDRSVDRARRDSLIRGKYLYGVPTAGGDVVRLRKEA